MADPEVASAHPRSSYGEYPHVLQKVIGCQVSRFALKRKERYAIEPERLRAVMQRGWI